MFNSQSRLAIMLPFAFAIARSGAQTLTLTITPSDYNGYGVSCYDARDGALDLQVSGGTPPYTYSWSTGATTQDLPVVGVGYYRVSVQDANHNGETAEIMVTQPAQLGISMDPYQYSNGYNISCYSCYNGSIGVTPEGGVAPYTYHWDDGATTEDRSGLGTGNYRVEVTDANGCVLQTEVLYLSQPERDDWGKSGNAGTNPATQYIGTSDAQDVVFKSNATEMLRLKSNGDISLQGSVGAGVLYRMNDGRLQGGGFPPEPIMAPLEPCVGGLEYFPLWLTIGNDFTTLCEPEEPLLGTLSDMPLHIITNGEERITVTSEGKVGIGTVPAAGPVQGYQLFVEDGIATRDVLVKTGSWPDHVFAAEYELLPMTNLRAYLRIHQHLPGIPSAKEVDEKGGVEVGDLQRRMLETIEQQALYILQLEERLGRVEQRLGTSRPSK